LRALQQPDGTWPHAKMGATALAGRTLLECGAKRDDPAVVKAAKAVRAAVVTCHDTYSLALAILFLDRLGEPRDIALIESMAVRLLAGQDSTTGGWGYDCPEVSAEEARRLEAHVRGPAGTDPAVPPEGRRTSNDLPPAIKKQLSLLVKAPRVAVPDGGDNCNTQFAALGLWTARRYGIPVNKAIARLTRRFHTDQHTDGGWGYKMGPNETMPSMTCAGILALELVHGMAREAGKHSDPAKDTSLVMALRAVSPSVGNPVGGRRGAIPAVKDRFFYFLWSLSRVCLSLDLKTLEKKDWYAWGAEILRANQGADGLWHGEFADCGADTCFALLFLERASLAPDLHVKKR
jgi:hypothetical protein